MKRRFFPLLLIFLLSNSLHSNNLKKVQTLYQDKKYGQAIQLVLLEAKEKEFSAQKVMLDFVLEKKMSFLEKKPLITYFEENAKKKNDVYLQNLLGILYYRGQGVKKNYKKSYYWHMKAAKNWHEDSFNAIGAMYFFGRGVKKNYSKAVHWYVKAVRTNNPYALTNLSVLYYKGLGVEKNIFKSKILMKKACDLKHPEAMELWKKYKY